MKLFTFTVYFHGGDEEVVEAANMTNAVILACANRIKQGKHHETYGAKCTEARDERRIKSAWPLAVNWD